MVAGLLAQARPRQGHGARLEIVGDNRVVHRRDFGGTTDEGEVVTAEISPDGMLNLRVFFPSLKQTREFGLMMQSDGTMRAIYNRNQKNEYTIKDGKFTANGDPTPRSISACSGRRRYVRAGIAAEQPFRILFAFPGNVPRDTMFNPRSNEEDNMKKFGYVIAALGAIAIAAPSIASAETVVIKHGDHHSAPAPNSANIAITAGTKAGVIAMPTGWWSSSTVITWTEG